MTRPTMTQADADALVEVETRCDQLHEALANAIRFPGENAAKYMQTIDEIRDRAITILTNHDITTGDTP
jgi:hypothetical protein